MQHSTAQLLLLLGHHTLGIECKGVLSTGVDRLLAGKRVGVGLTRSTIRSFAPIQIFHHGFEKALLMWWGLGRWILPTRPASSYKPNKSAVSGMMITTQLSRPRNIITFACGG